MRLYSYVVARDYGFAPNPFGGVCTLATCKPEIRRRASVGDWVAGIASRRDTKVASLIYVMCVDEVLTYDSYWVDPRLQFKKPNRRGSVKKLFGDNIYRRGPTGNWIQEDSHHSLDDGAPNQRNIDNDTKSEGVLVGWRFAYWGRRSVAIPGEFLDFDGESIMLTRGYKTHFSDEFVEAFVQWVEGLGVQGFVAAPYRW